MGEGTEADRAPWPVAPVSHGDTANALESSRGARRSRVYDNLIKAWKAAESSAEIPKPRSSHSRQTVVFTRQRQPSTPRGDTTRLRQTWGNLSDTVSTAAQCAWREQLQRRNLCRLASVPATVLLNQEVELAEKRRVITAAPDLSPEMTARMVVAGDYGLAGHRGGAKETGSEVNPRLRQGLVHRAQRGGGGYPMCEVTSQEAATAKGCRGASINAASVSGKCVSLQKHAGSVRSAHGTGAWSTHRSQEGVSVLPTGLPRRGFHLIDLHAVVRNSVEWSHYLPKVEPCFRVGDNRDDILIGLVHALGSRLSCSSVRDIQAAVRATRCGSLSPAPPPRTLDRHVCRSPALLRAAVEAGVRLYEVDCAEELRRIGRARSKLEKTSKARLAKAAGPETRNTASLDVGPAEVLIRLALPSRGRPTAALGENASTSSHPEDSSAPVDAAYGASAEDVDKLVTAAVKMVAAAPVVDRDTFPSGRGAASPPRIVGFSIDVGQACYEDARAAMTPPPTRVLSNVSTSFEEDVSVASGVLSEGIAAAVANAVEAARRAAKVALHAAESAAVKGGDDASRPRCESSGQAAAAAACGFSFRRLHVTGLGNGGARREPLAALQSARSRHLPAAGTDEGYAVGTAGRPIMLSADATQHLVAGGVWSTVTNIIGRKSVATNEPGGIARCAESKEHETPDRRQTCALERERRNDVGAMYYIDDGCYGCLGSALLRGVLLQPSPLSGRGTRQLASDAMADRKQWKTADGEQETSIAAAAAVPHAPCTVWGPTCDGLDCVSRVAPLPADMEPGRDWLFFPDMGLRAGADATNFNGLKPLDSFYCLRRHEEGESFFPPASPANSLR